MPTKREREYYRMGFSDGVRSIQGSVDPVSAILSKRPSREYGPQGGRLTYTDITKKPKRKLSPWNKFVKANSKKPRFIYKSGSNKGKLNLKKMGVAFRKTPAGKRKK
jgi:hypothetical protein